MTTITVFEKPRQFITRGGSDVMIFCKGKGMGGNEKFFGVVDHGGELMDASWLICGRYNPYEIKESVLDLVEEK